MPTDLSGITVDVARAEASRFRHPLLLLHGLWTGGWIWRDFSAYLAHRGWDAWVPSFLSGREAPGVESRRRALLDVCRDLPAPPVVVAHDAGLVFADLIARDLPLPAIVAIAPLALRRPAVWNRPRWWSAALGGDRVAPPEGAADPFASGISEADVRRLRTDSGELFRRVGLREREPGRLVLPGLVVAAEADPAARLADCRGLAAQRSWDLRIQAVSSHFPMLGRSATRLADSVHRWIVRTLGADLLAWVEDDEPDE
ncbi:MAG: alpha/beta hydrolase [Deltaproteobacteria bacterium]|nr:alpha/beta hydrolase [Deltaproteobacteria bacterium]